MLKNQSMQTQQYYNMNERRCNIFLPFTILVCPTSTSRALQLSLYQHARRQQLHSSLLVMALLPKEDVSATQILCQYPILVYVARKRRVSRLSVQLYVPSEQKLRA